MAAKKKKRKIRARRKRPDISKWRDEFIYKAYQYAKEGLSNKKIAGALGVGIDAFKNYYKKHPAFRKAIEDGRDKDSSIDFANYVYNKLDPHLQALWDELDAVDGSDRGFRSKAQINAILANTGKRARQSLFVYAWTKGHFAISHALSKCGIPRCTFDVWCNEPEFRKLVQEITWHKKMFFEEALIKACRRGEIAAIIFANKTFNKDLGYNEKIDISVTAKAEPMVAPVSELNLTLAERRKLLGKIREQKELKNVEGEVEQ